MVRLRKRRRNGSMHWQENDSNLSPSLEERSLPSRFTYEHRILNSMVGIDSRNQNETNLSNKSGKYEHLDPEALRRDSHGQNQIHVAYNCLIIPLVLALWWYYTKQSARRFRRKLLLLTHASTKSNCSNDSDESNGFYFVPNCSDTHELNQNHNGSVVKRDDIDIINGVPVISKEDCYQSWDEVVLEQEHGKEASNRLVRWIRVGRKHKRRQSHVDTIESPTRQSLRQRKSILSRPKKKKRSLNIDAKNSTNAVHSPLGISPNQLGIFPNQSTSMDSICICVLENTNDDDNGSEYSLSSASDVSISSVHSSSYNRRNWQCIPDTTAAVEICTVSLQREYFLNDNSSDDVTFISSRLSRNNNNDDGIACQQGEYHFVRPAKSNTNVVQNSFMKPEQLRNGNSSQVQKGDSFV
jgi:hypothetical protein